MTGVDDARSELARLLDTGATAVVENPYGLFVGTLWTTFFTALDPTRTNFYCWEEIDQHTYERRLTSPEDLCGVPFWERLCHFFGMQSLIKADEIVYCIGGRTGILVRADDLFE